MKKGLIILFSLFWISNYSISQNYTEYTLRIMLDSIAIEHPGLDNGLQLNVNSIELSELVNSVALENDLNISVDPSLDQLISYNFFDAQVKDLLVFLYLNFELEYEFIGSIISLKKREAAPPPPKEVAPEVIDINYNKANNFLSMNLQSDTLWKVTEEITKQSGKNFVVDPEIRNNVVNAYLLNRPFENVLDMFVKSNSFILTTEEDHYRISKGTTITPTAIKESSAYVFNKRVGNFVLTKNPIGTIDVFANDVNLSELVHAAADETGIHYVIYSNLQGKINLDVKDVRFDELINMAFNGSNYSIREENGVYLIGENKQNGLRITKLIRLENRTIESVKTSIPKELIADVEISEFEELNGLIVTGTQRKVTALNDFLSTIDVVVPMVQIDVMLLYSSKGAALKTGIKAGVKDEPTTTSGEVFPVVDMQLGAGSINTILNAISGFGLVNLGQVSSNFYLQLQAMESNNIIKIESTPKISTLNGHEASISIGETTYYQEVQVNVQTSVTNQGVLESKQWKSIDANLSVTIKPFVSADEYVTLTITVEQSDFSGKVSPESPPNMTTQTFQSVVRVKNGELILLGGLEKKKKSDSGQGVPFLSKIPVIKWFFSSREKEDDMSKLHILIKPTVTY